MYKIIRMLIYIYLFVALIFIISPIVSIFIMSFHEGQIQVFPIQSYSFKWYYEAWNNESFRSGLLTSLKVAICVAPISTILGFISAYYVCRYQNNNRVLYIVLICLPCFTPLLLSGFSLLIYYQTINIYGSIYGIIIAHVTYSSPFALAIIRNSYNKLNEEIEYAARNLGAGTIEIIIKIVIPQLWPSLISSFAVAFLISWDEYILAWFVGGFTKTLPTVIYGSMGTSFTPAINSVGVIVVVASSIILAIAISLQLLFYKFIKNETV